MTDQEIDNLRPGRQTDKVVAEHIFGIVSLSSDNKAGLVAQYSTNIRSAFHIVYHWLHFYPVLITYRPTEKDWWVIFVDQCGHSPSSPKHGPNCFREAFALSPELAICKAALKMAFKKSEKPT